MFYLSLKSTRSRLMSMKKHRIYKGVIREGLTERLSSEYYLRIPLIAKVLELGVSNTQLLL